MRSGVGTTFAALLRVSEGPVDRLERRIRQLGRHSAGLQQLAIDVAGELAVIRRTLRADASGRLEAAIEYALLRAAESRRRASLRAAVVGAWKIDTRLQRGGAMLVRIDEGKWFRLSRGDGRLLRLLASAAIEDDGFPAWQTYEQVALQIARTSGVEPTRHAIVQAVHRIRRALKLADLNEYLLRVDRKAGRLRFLLRSVVDPRAAARRQGPTRLESHSSGPSETGP